MSEDGVVFSLAAIRVTDLGRSVEFYTKACGFAVEREFATDTFRAVIVRAGAAGIELILPTDGSQSQPPDRGNMFTKFVLNTADPAAVMSRACELGGTVITAATEYPEYGMTIGVISDPDGYELEFVGRPARSAR
ncbi:UNVERIFIED_ORG: lactoylglutathione lyase [Gordonia westfalica J30]